MSRAWPISTKFVRVPDSAGVAKPPAYNEYENVIKERQSEITYLLLSRVQRVLILVFIPVSNQNTIRNNEGPLFPASLLPRQVPYFRYILPFLISDSRQPPFQISKLLLNLRPLRTMLFQLQLLLRLSKNAEGGMMSEEREKTSKLTRRAHTSAPSAVSP